MWNLKKYNKLVNKTKKKQTQIQRRISGYQWGEGRGWGANIGVGKKKVVTGLYEIMCVKLWKIVKLYRI